MAIFSVNLRPFTRAKGESAVAAAAYRAGVALTDDRTGVRHDYTRRNGVEAVEMVLPADAPPWAGDLGTFWNHVEAAEVRINSRVARELLVALPHELPGASRLALARAIAQHLVDRYGVGVQVAVHAPDRKGDDRNHHAHLLLTTRVLGAEGLGAKVRCLDDQKQGPVEVETIRATVAALTNAHLAASQVPERVDHRTLAVQAQEAEQAGDLDRAARLTREPTQRVPRAEVEDARRGRVSAAIRDNQNRVACHAKDLAVYQKAVSPQGRERLRQAVEARWKARRTKAAVVVHPSAPAVRPGLSGKRRRLEDELLDTVRAGGRMASAVIHAGGQRDRMIDRLAYHQSPEVQALRQRAEAAQAELGRAQAELATRRARLKEAERLRSTTQQAWDTGRPRPRVWQPTQRKAWDVDRKQLWGRLRKAIAAERAAAQGLGPVARAALRANVAEARQRLANAEAELRRARDPAPSVSPSPEPVREHGPHDRSGTRFAP